jgi:succinate-semialdehyde dehydrogenase / glutarate-semialdehyde dehydrogenase
MVSGDTEAIGNALLDSKAVRKIGFTGSTKAGKFLMGRSADTIKRVIMELGGNVPFIVFEDADVEAAAKAAVDSGLFHTGQVCIAGNRMLVHVRPDKRVLCYAAGSVLLDVLAVLPASGA